MPTRTSRKARKARKSKTTRHRRRGGGDFPFLPFLPVLFGSSAYTSRKKKSEEYAEAMPEQTKTSGRSRKAHTNKKKSSGVVCICAAECTKEHEHGKDCQRSLVCVCAHGKTTKKRDSRKSSVVYRQITREGYVRKDGVYVPPTKIEDRGLPGKGPKTLPKLRQGTLRRHGYDSKASTASRHEALQKAVAAEGATVIIRKLNVVATLNKNTNPTLSAHLKSDSAWVKSKFGTTAHPV